MNEKKVILFIVEGPSDRAALGTIMEEYFKGKWTNKGKIKGIKEKI